MVDAANAWAAGSEMISPQQLAYRAYKLQWQDGRWRVTYTQDFPKYISAIVAASDDKVWVAGSDGLYMRKDSEGWHDMPNPLSGYTHTTFKDRKSTRLNSSHLGISYAV